MICLSIHNSRELMDIYWSLVLVKVFLRGKLWEPLPSFDVVPCVTQLQRSLFRFELRSRSLPEFSSHRINKTIMAFLTCNVSRNLIAFQLGNDRL